MKMYVVTRFVPVTMYIVGNNRTELWFNFVIIGNYTKHFVGLFFDR